MIFPSMIAMNSFVSICDVQIISPFLVGIVLSEVGQEQDNIIVLDDNDDAITSPL